MDQNQPIETFRDGRLKATVWENVSERNEPYHTVTLAKTYEDRNGRLQDSHSFSASELLRVAELAREAHGAVRALRREMAQERRYDQHPDQRSARSAPPREGRQGRFPKHSGPGLER